MSSAIQPHQIASLLDEWPDVRCLSLDCFDTLLWRDVRDADGWGDRLRYLVKPPGWSPDGSPRTAAQQKIDAGLDERRGLPGLLGAI